jgi:hypothetical protein
LKDNAYLCSYGTGGGSWYTCNGIGSSDDFATTPIKSVFTVFLGSYFGDWDNESAFLRAPLGSGYCLATAWGGRPHWFLHPMGLGETIGYTAKLSQNNRPGGVYSPQNYGSHWVHVALLGDPTLRLHPVIPPSNVTAGVGSGVTLNWNASTDSNIQGYVVYRASSVNGPFTKISGTSLLSTLGISDATGAAGMVYMVRAVKLETSGSGTYFNPSEGVIVVAGGGTAGTGTDSGSTSTPPATTVPPTTTQTPPQTSSENSASYVGSDTATGGNWKTAYQADGQVIIGDSSAIPAYAAYAPASGYLSWTWADPATDAGSLQRAASTARLASCWYSPTELSMNFHFTDGQAHQVSFYFLDWDKAGRQQTLELYNADSGALLASHAITSFSGGIYSTWDLQGNVRARLVRVSGPNCVVSGVFFGVPTGGTTTGSSGGTTDGGTSTGATGSTGSTGTTGSTTGGSTGTITPPPTSGLNAVRALPENTVVMGTWKGTYGAQGYQLAADASKLPSYASISVTGKSDWVWNWSTSDASAVQRAAAADRLAACYYAASTFDVGVKITDGQTHKVSFYCLDWDAQGRTQKIDVLDASTGAILNTTTVSGFQKGTYLSWDVKGAVTFRFTRTGPLNAVASGIFFDAPSAAL